jgi:hypothetical protein
MLREVAIEAALADYYQATAATEQIWSTARNKAEATLAEAERAAAAPIAAAHDAVRRLRDLLGGNTEVAELCGISTAAVREILSEGQRDDASLRVRRPGQSDAAGGPRLR